MSTYNIREKFFYAIAPESQSLNYVRYYNFNTSTVSDIPIVMGNTDQEVPITVNISTDEPWMVVVDPETGNDLRYPSGNVVLPPSSSKLVVLKVDLPPEIENVPTSDFYKNVRLDIKSGSAPIIRSAESLATNNT